MLSCLLLCSKLFRILIKVYLHQQFDASLLELQGSLQSNYKDMDDKFKMLRKRLSKDHAKVLYCLDDLGLMCAYEV
jgi:hypothetical protein